VKATRGETRTATTTFVQCRGVIDGTRAGLRAGAGLVMRDGRVVGVAPLDEVPDADVTVLDFGDHYLVPGFVDAHTHITIRPGEGDQHGQLRRPPAWQAIRGVANLRDMLRSGVTTARIMTETSDIDFEFKARIARGEVTGPRLHVSGPGLSPPGGHGSAGAGVSGPGDLRAAVRSNAAKGADHIKMFTTGGVSSSGTGLDVSNYSAGEIAATIDEAGRHGLPVSAHAHGGPGAELAVDAGIHSIEHGALLSPEIIAKMKSRGTWLVATNSILFHPTGIEQGDAREPSIMTKVTQARASARDTLRAVRAAGLNVAVGTDSMHGLIGFEMEWLVQHGWSELAALIAGTASGAAVLRDPTCGTLEPGKRADFVLLRRNPLDDITAVYEVDSVFRSGQQVTSAGGLSGGQPDDEPLTRSAAPAEA
jgi:imidazolonepropionase-like amidohydrolase